MSDTTTKPRRQASARQIAANRSNSTKSTGAKTESGRMRSSMNHCIHGMFSTKDFLPFECPIERQQLVDEITAAAKPVDGLQRLLTERIIKTAVRVRRGERGQVAKAQKSVNALVERTGRENARRAEALGATLDENVDAYHELRTFPEGLAYILDQWSVILESLSQALPLLGSTRNRCFSLVGKTRDHLLRSDPTAAFWFLNLTALMYGQEATLEDIVALLGTEPPEWMDEAEFVTRAQRLRSAVPAEAVAREDLKGRVSAIMKDLNTELTRAREVAARDLELDTAVACADATPEGTKLTNAIDKVDRSCLAAIRRLEARQRAQDPGPEQDPEPSADTAEDLDDMVEPDQAEPTDVVADVEETVAAEVPTDEKPAPVAATTTEADEAAPAASTEAGPEKGEVEVNSGPDPIEPGPKKCRDEANCGYGIKEPDFERFGPEADRLRRLYHHLQATDGPGEPGADRDRTQTDSRMARAMEVHAIQLQELSRQIDARFGINGERPEPEGPASTPSSRPQSVVADGSANLSPLTKGGYRGVPKRCHPEDSGLEFTPPTPPS